MQITMHDTLVPTANRMLGNLSTFLDKAAAFAEAKKFDVAVLLNARLALCEPRGLQIGMHVLEERHRQMRVEAEIQKQPRRRDKRARE